MNGYLEITIGPMFAGKTTKLLSQYREHMNTKRVIAINHKLDDDINTENNRGYIVSHDEDNIKCVVTNNLNEEWNTNSLLQESEYIFINEAQFFEDLYDVVYEMLRINKTVFLYGLDGDYKQEKFGKIIDLIPLCDKIEKLHASCMKCGSNGIFTMRTNKSDELIQIGALHYDSVCRKCLRKEEYKTINKIPNVD